MSFHNSRNASKSFKSPFKNDDARSSPLIEKTLIEEYQTLSRKEAQLDQEISNLTSSGASRSDVQTVMSLLHKFNEVKDATQVVLGRLATLEGQTIQQLHKRFGLDDKDWLGTDWSAVINLPFKSYLYLVSSTVF